MKLLSSSICTKSNGCFEVTYTIDSFWRKVFFRKTTYKYQCSHFYSFTNKVCLPWWDEKYYIVTDPEVLKLLNSIIALHNNIDDNGLIQ